MKRLNPHRQMSWFRVSIYFILTIFFVSSVLPPEKLWAQVSAPSLQLSAPGQIISLSPIFTPPTLKAIQVDPKDPLKLNFVIEPGDSKLHGEALKKESEKLVRYFLAALTVPENDLWVNLSPQERIASCQRNWE